MPADVDEVYLGGETPAEHVERLARAKATAIWEREPDALVLGGDTVVLDGERVLGKPEHQAAAVDMLVSLAGTGVMLSDGATNLLPVPRHRPQPGTSLTSQQARENREAVHAAWRVHFEDVRHSLVNGFYQGWDLHPGQLVTRYAALYAFFLESLDSASERLRRFVEQAAQATLTGGVFDDAATGQGLLNYFLRGLACGALSEDEAKRTGLTLAQLQTRSFRRILEGQGS